MKRDFTKMYTPFSNRSLYLNSLHKNHFKKILFTVYSQDKHLAFLYLEAELSATGRVVRYVRFALSATGQVVHGPSCLATDTCITQPHGDMSI